MGSIVKGIGKALGFSQPEKPDYSGAIKAAQFKPYSLTTGFGSSTFDTGAGTGTYTLDPRLAAMRDVLYGGAMEAVPDTSQKAFAEQLRREGQGLFTSAAAMSPDKLAQDYLERQLNILAPSRAEEEARLQDTLFKSGRTGAAVGIQGGYVNPEQFAYLKAKEGQNAQLALEASNRARGIQLEDLQRALGYYGLASQLEAQPYEQAASLFGLGTNLEKLGMTPLSMGVDIGSAASRSGANVANLLMDQENTRVRYANDPGFWGSLVAGGIQSFANPLGRSLGNTVSGWFSSPTSGAGQAPGTGIRLI